MHAEVPTGQEIIGKASQHLVGLSDDCLEFCGVCAARVAQIYFVVMLCGVIWGLRIRLYEVRKGSSLVCSAKG